MSQHLVVDRSGCAGHGLCYGSAPALVDADEQGDPVVLHDPVPDEELATVRKLIDLCPERALSLQETLESAFRH
jgi:ferredoxin